MAFQIGTAPIGEVKKTPQLPKALVTAKPDTQDGVDGLLVQVFYPLPDDLEPIVVERKGKKTAKVDNSDKVVSVLTTVGRTVKYGLTMITEAGDEVALIDQNQNQLLFTSKLTTVAGEGEDEDEDATTE